MRVPLIGRFNVANSIAALAAANALGISVREAILSLGKSPQVPGRLEAVPAKRQFQVFVDYAHTDDALLNVLKTFATLRPRKLIVVFGCGGDRDRQKRPLMGRVAIRTPTSASSLPTIRGKKIPTRSSPKSRKVFAPRITKKSRIAPQAISRAIALAQPHDIVLIAGKGHEAYQEFADHTVPFDDVQVARRALEDHPVEF